MKIYNVLEDEYSKEHLTNLTFMWPCVVINFL